MKLTQINKIDYQEIATMPSYNYNMENKKAWGHAGVASLKELAKSINAVPVNISHNPSGIIDRGYVSGFVSRMDGTKHIYISINDGMQDILYRTAKHAKDYTGGSNNTCNIDDEGFQKIRDFIINYFRD